MVKKCTVPPTQKQIDFVKDICDALGIRNFPSYSGEYNIRSYSQFISDHIIQYDELVHGIDEPDDTDWDYAPEERF